MEKSRENNLLGLLEKEGQIKVLQEKIISYEKEKKSQIDHAELLCTVNISQKNQILKKMIVDF